MKISKFPPCPICYKRHVKYPKECSEFLKSKNLEESNPKTYLLIEYLKELREKFGIHER